MTAADLAARWRQDAETFARYGDEQMAHVCRSHADELESSLRSQADDVLDLATAAEVSGYSADRLRHKVAAGEIPNAGRRGSPRVRRGDLPVKPRRAAGAFDAAAVARDVLQLGAKHHG